MNIAEIKKLKWLSGNMLKDYMKIKLYKIN